ncbi:hypothetical protein ASZ90_008110 [hydrocarbon metagenome]|uniref:Uncharacterized protein n=1 Tax=hydrocarbon metagenome TaxID=938273 RepID=A0A0W8FMP7_9ZZZZ
MVNFYSHHPGIAALFTYKILLLIVNVKECVEYKHFTVGTHTQIINIIK